MSGRTLIVRRVGIGPIARWGFAAGALVACLPAFLCSMLVFIVAQSAYRLVAGWQDVGVTLLGQRVALNMVDLLHLDPVLTLLRAADALGVLGILLLSLVLTAILGLIVSLAFVLLALLYNLTGRMELEVVEK